MSDQPRTAEHQRLAEDKTREKPWRSWGPYLSERQWGTVREDYSANGDAWDYFTHRMACSRSYRWGEDGIGGLCDDKQQLCLALALWNGRDPILKERLFGLTNGQGNHGEDVKEIYYYLDATPTHSYLRMLYKYPQSRFPYDQLVEENAHRGKQDSEFELIDTGIFDEDRYFDVFVEYAKADPQDILMRLTLHNRGPDAATIHVLPQLWFRNTWSWTTTGPKPVLRADGESAIIADHHVLGRWYLYADTANELLFCDNETNNRKLGYEPAKTGYFKDGIHDYLVGAQSRAINPMRTGTKAAVHHRVEIPAGGSNVIRVRLASSSLRTTGPFHGFDEIFATRIAEADDYHASLQGKLDDEDAIRIQRQALAGMIWCKQFYYLDIPQWLQGDPTQPPPPRQRLNGRNRDWEHLNNADVLSMPDTWEYPWYAAWDLAFHCLPLARMDAEFAKDQLVRLTREWYMHPNGQLPAYEWDFGDVNPPVHAWAVLRVFQIDRAQRGDQGDLQFLERVFHKLLINFTWWVNRKDADDRNIFQGGFLGLDNIGVFDRSKPLPTGGFIDQADGTAWMAMYCLNMMHIALTLALRHNRVYEDIATKFFEHFLHVAEAMEKRIGEAGLWSEKEGFYYDVLSLPDGNRIPLKIHSMVGLIPLFAVEVLDARYREELPDFAARLQWFLQYRPDLANLVSHWYEPGQNRRMLLSLLRGHRMKCLLTRLLDETRFLSDYGIRSLSRMHRDQPYVFELGDHYESLAYEPGESTTDAFGGNSNWRGPIWMPLNYLLIESLQRFYEYYGDRFQVEYPTGSGRLYSLQQISIELARRLCRLFLRNGEGRRPIFSDCTKFQADPHFRDHLLFHEYFHGDSGQGLGASHQTGWTGLIVLLLQMQADHGGDELI